MGPDPSHPKTARLKRGASRQRQRRLEVDDVTVVDKPMMRRAIGGTVVGNTMEWYDVGIYGYLAVTMGQVFLPTAEPTVQILFSLGVFASTYIARPLGGIVFGRFGDRIGRQKVLAATLILMAGSTFLIGVLPDFAMAGPLAPVLLVVLKMTQGFSTGGEYSGASTFISEYAPDRRRGWFSSFLDTGSYVGFALGAAVVSILQITLGQEALVEWAWRIPFLIAGPIGAVAIYFRLKIEESPAFQAVQDAHESTNAEIADSMGRPSLPTMIRQQWRPMLILVGIVAAGNTVGYALTSYMPTYLTDTMGYDPLHGTLLTIPVLLFMSALLPVTGRLSDRFGRKPVLLTGAASVLVLTVPAFLLIGIGPIWTTLLGLALIALTAALWISNQAATLPALFPTNTRYGAMGFSHNIAIAVFGGTTPLIIQGLITVTGNDLAPAFFLMAASIGGAVAVLCMKESSQRPMPGSMPNVETEQEARELVESQDTNPHLDLGELPFMDHSAVLGRREEPEKV